MNTTSIIACAAVSAFGAASAAAQGWEASAGYTFFDGDGVDFSTITLRATYFANENFGLEAEGIFGLDDDDLSELDAFGTDFDAELDFGFGGFGVARFPLNDRFGVFARGGFQAIRISIEGEDFVDGLLGSVAESDLDVGFAAGGGITYSLNERNLLRIGYTRTGVTDANQYGISYVRRF